MTTIANRTASIALIGLCLCGPAHAEPGRTAYSWRTGAASQWPDATLRSRIAPPAGFLRAALPPGSFGEWLGGLPLKPIGAVVHLHTGAIKPRQDVHAAVIDVDVGSRDLQQCADAIMRLRGEWLFGAGRTTEISFNDTGGGKPMAFSRWAAGERPRLDGRALTWSRSAPPDAGYQSFRRYMDTVFVWAGTASLSREMQSVQGGGVEPGDVFIQGGFPGHAVLVVDVAANAAGEHRMLLAQSYMPAQDIHVLMNPADPTQSPWYAIPMSGAPLVTPEWIFPPGSHKRWRRGN